MNKFYKILSLIIFNYIYIGTIRADQIIPEGEIKFDTLNKLLPIHDTILSMEINGK